MNYSGCHLISYVIPILNTAIDLPIAYLHLYLCGVLRWDHAQSIIHMHGICLDLRTWDWKDCQRLPRQETVRFRILCVCLISFTFFLTWELCYRFLHPLSLSLYIGFMWRMCGVSIFSGASLFRPHSLHSLMQSGCIGVKFKDCRHRHRYRGIVVVVLVVPRCPMKWKMWIYMNEYAA